MRCWLSDWCQGDSWVSQHLFLRSSTPGIGFPHEYILVYVPPPPPYQSRGGGFLWCVPSSLGWCFLGAWEKNDVWLFLRAVESSRVVFVSFRYVTLHFVVAFRCCVSLLRFVALFVFSFRGCATFRFDVTFRFVTFTVWVFHFASFFASFCYAVCVSFWYSVPIRWYVSFQLNVSGLRFVSYFVSLRASFRFVLTFRFAYVGTFHLVCRSIALREVPCGFETIPTAALFGAGKPLCCAVLCCVSCLACFFFLS